MAQPLDDLDDGTIPEDEQAKRKAIRDKRTGKALEDEWSQQDRAALQKYMDKIGPPIIVEPRCSICNHPFREFIEDAVTTKGQGYKRIEEHIARIEGAPKADRRSIKKHIEEHLKLEQKRIRAELDEAAAELAQPEDAGRGVFTERGALKILIRKTFELALAGAVNVEARDMIQMVKLLNDMEVKQAGSKADEHELYLRTFVKAVQNTCDAEQLYAIVSEVKRLRALDDIDDTMENMLEGPQQALPVAVTVPDGEISTSQ